MKSRLEILIHKLHTSGVSPEEEHELGVLLNVKNPEVQVIKDVCNPLDLSIEKSKKSSWNAIMHAIEAKPKSRMPVFSIFSTRLKIAASIVFVFVVASAWFFNLKNSQVYNVPVATQQTVELKDGTQIILDADSKLKVRHNPLSSIRELELEGRGLFKVSKGAPFIVHTPKGNVEVLGTQFTIDQYANGFIVKCFSGIVRVSNKLRKQTVVLKKGDFTYLKNNTLSKSKFRPNIPVWVSGKYTFEHAPLEEVVLELQRQFGKEVVYVGPNEKFYTGEFSEGDLTKALDMVCLPLGLHYELSEERVTIKP